MKKEVPTNSTLVNGVNDLKVQLRNRSRGETFNNAMSFRMSQKHREKLSALSVKYDADMGSVIRALISLFNDDEFDADVRGVVVSNSGTIEHPLILKMDMLDNKMESLLSSVGDLVAEVRGQKTHYKSKPMKKYVVGVLSMFENDLKLFKIEAESDYEAVKKAMVEFADDPENKQHEIDWQNSEDYPTDLEGLCRVYEEVPFSVVEVGSF